MKRLTAVLLALCLLYGAAYAETATGALRVIGGSDAVQAYQAQYPGREVEEIRPEYDDYGNSNIRELLLGGDWDVACIYTDACDLGALAGAGVLMDLSAVPAASGAMHPIGSTKFSDPIRVGQLILFNIKQVFDLLWRHIGIMRIDCPNQKKQRFTILTSHIFV